MAGPAFDYVAGGAWDEITLAESVEAWRRYRFVPRVLRDVRTIDLSGSSSAGRRPCPIAVAPMAAQVLAHPGGEAELFAGAAAAGVPYCLSTSSSLSLEDVAAAAPDAERWFQLYVVGDLAYSRTLVERAAAAGYRAIVLTVDLPVFGHRERDDRRGSSSGEAAHDAAVEERGQAGYGALEDQRIAGLTWDSLAEIRSWSQLPLVVKGILSPDDARLAVEAGVDAIVVSTHGGRQLDRAISTADALPGDRRGRRRSVRGLGRRRDPARPRRARRRSPSARPACSSAGRSTGRSPRAGGPASSAPSRSCAAELETALALLGCASLAESGGAAREALGRLAAASRRARAGTGRAGAADGRRAASGGRSRPRGRGASRCAP